MNFLNMVPLAQRAQVRFPVGSVFLIKIFSRRFSSTVRQMPGKLPHLSPDIIGHHNHQTRVPMTLAPIFTVLHTVSYISLPFIESAVESVTICCCL